MIADPAWKSALLHEGKDGEDPELRLRNFLDQIDRAIKTFDTDAFGRCQFCGAELDRGALQQQPWLAACPVHAGRWIS